MKELDSDKKLLRSSQGHTAARDVVQFVKFKKYVAQGPAVLAEKVLKEVPDQFVNYMMNNKIMPAPSGWAQY
jgi:Copine